MKNLLTVALALICVAASAQIETPQASSAGSVSSRIGLTDVKIEYSRPKMKGRKIFGDGEVLIPNGKIWRTGANYGTRITFSDTVKVEGTTVPMGTYLIFTWPGAAEWTVALYKDLSLGGNTSGYDAAKEQARFKVKSEKLAETITTFTMAIGDLSDDNISGKVQIAWENTSVKFAVTASFDAHVMKAIASSTKVNPDALLTAAHYYYDNKKDMKQALTWVNEYLAATPNSSDEFYNVYFKAQVQKALGDKAGALATSQKSLETAKKAPNDFGYIKLNEDLIKSMK